MHDILMVCHREDGSICAMYQIHGDRHNWEHCFPLIRDNEPTMVDFNVYRVDRYRSANSAARDPRQLGR